MKKRFHSATQPLDQPSEDNVQVTDVKTDLRKISGPERIQMQLVAAKERLAKLEAKMYARKAENVDVRGKEGYDSVYSVVKQFISQHQVPIVAFTQALVKDTFGDNYAVTIRAKRAPRSEEQRKLIAAKRMETMKARILGQEPPKVKKPK